MTRVGLVGVGHWGQYILRDLVALGCEVSAVVRSAESTERAKAGGAQHIYGSVDALPLQDAYVVATPSLNHAAQLAELLPRGKPIFVEKPVTTSSAAAADLGPDGRRLVFCMDKWRYHPGVLWLAACARERRLGEVQGVHLIRVGGVSKFFSPVSSIWHLVPHDLSIALEILGDLPPVRAATASVFGDWAYGCHAVLGTKPWVVVEASERRAQHYREVRLICDQGEAVLSGAYADGIIVRRHDARTLGAPEKVALPGDMPLLAELNAFVRYVRDEGPAPKSSLAEASLVVRRIEEIHAAANVSPDALLSPS